MRSMLIALLIAYVVASDVDYKLIGSNMVLQRDSPNVRLWGKTDTGSIATLQIYRNGVLIDTYTTSINSQLWEIHINAYPAGGPYDFIVSTPSPRNYTNVMFGDVFHCAGQSNMEFTVIQSENGTAEVADSINYPNLYF